MDEVDAVMDDEQVDQNVVSDEGVESYDPDPDDTDDAGDDTPTSTVPVVRSKGMRNKVLATQRPKAKKPRNVSKGGGRILAKEKQRQALELRKGGASYAAIAKAVGYADQGGARKAVVKAFSEIIQEPALEVKSLQIERLNHMLLTLWPKVQQGDERSIDTSLRVMDKIDRLMGTEAAQQVDVNVNRKDAILVIDGSKDDFMRGLKQMAGIAGDGSNKEIAAYTPPSGVIEGSVVEFPADDGTSLYDALGEEGREALHSIMAPPPEADSAEPKKKYSFGVDPGGSTQ